MIARLPRFRKTRPHSPSTRKREALSGRGCSRNASGRSPRRSVWIIRPTPACDTRSPAPSRSERSSSMERTRDANSSGCSAPYPLTISMAVIRRVGLPDAVPTSNSVARPSISTSSGNSRIRRTISAVSKALESGDETIHSTSFGTRAAAPRACTRPASVSGESIPCPAKMPAALAALSPCRRNQMGTGPAYAERHPAQERLVAPATGDLEQGPVDRCHRGGHRMSPNSREPDLRLTHPPGVGLCGSRTGPRCTSPMDVSKVQRTGDDDADNQQGLKGNHDPTPMAGEFDGEQDQHPDRKGQTESEPPGGLDPRHRRHLLSHANQVNPIA